MTGDLQCLWSELDAVFEEERDVLLTGSLARLDFLTRQKSDLLRKLIEHPGHRTSVAPKGLLSKAQRNANLLGQALGGLQAARGRVAEIQIAQRGLATYGPGGQRVTIKARGPGKLERRA